MDMPCGPVVVAQCAFAFVAFATSAAVAQDATTSSFGAAPDHGAWADFADLASSVDPDMLARADDSADYALRAAAQGTPDLIFGQPDAAGRAEPGDDRQPTDLAPIEDGDAVAPSGRPADPVEPPLDDPGQFDAADASIDLPGRDWDFARQGEWRWVIYGGFADDLRRSDLQVNLNVGASYFVVDDLSVNFELGGFYFDQEDRPTSEDAFGANFALLFRWHIISRENWSFYTDGGGGFLIATEEVPDTGTIFNFTPQAGFGFSFDVGDEGARLMTGVRWHHISNARMWGEDENPGRDAIMGYVGLSFPLE